MKTRHLLRFAMLICAAAFWSAAAQAAITCSATSSAITSIYDPTAAVANDNASSVTITCVRGAANDNNSISYGLAANNGLYPAGWDNQAALGANRIRYEVYRNTNRSQRWGGTTFQDINGTIPLSGFTPASVTVPYYSRIPAGQLVPDGTYSDMVTVTLRYGRNTSNLNQIAPSQTIDVQILVNPSCQFSTPPGSIQFAYTSFQANPANASTPFAVLCTNGTPYTLSLDSTGGTLLGLTYSLALSSSLSTGTGAAQAFSINGTIAGGQVGTCATATCTATNVHTLTISY